MNIFVNFLTFLYRYYHYGYDKIDNVDEIGQPINEDLIFNRCQEDDASTLVEETCEVPDFSDQFDKRCCSFDDEEIEKLPVTTDEGTQNVDEVIEILPQLEITTEIPSKPSLPDVKDTRHTNVYSPSLRLNVFDQTTIVKLFSAKNWTETFFNRVFRKKFLVVSAGGNERLAAAFLKDSRLLSVELEEQLLHMTQMCPTQDFQLPAIVSRDGMTRDCFREKA